MMPSPDPSRIVGEYVELVWNQGDLPALHRLTSPEFVYFLGTHPGRNRAEMEAFLAQTRAAFPDWRVDVAATVTDGATVAVRWTGEVTHGGDFHGVPATGRRVRVSGINMYRVEEGKITAEWEQMDSLGMLRQLGIGG